MTTATDEAMTHEKKADFGSIYTADDPRPYCRTLEPLGYQVPHRALPVIETVLDLAGGQGRPRTTLLDVCCSYGLISAMLHTSGTPEQVTARYADPTLAGLDTAALMAADRSFYDRPRPELSVLGLDRSAPAVEYARGAGLLENGWAEDLESRDPSPELAAGVRELDVITCTGGVGYVGAPTFRRILDEVREPSRLWLVVFVLRVFDYAPIADVLAGHGLVTERLPGTIPQRRFADRSEQDGAVAGVRRRGLDPTGYETDGWFHAEAFLSRPADAAERWPVERVDELVAQLRSW